MERFFEISDQNQILLNEQGDGRGGSIFFDTPISAIGSLIDLQRVLVALRRKINLFGLLIVTTGSISLMADVLPTWKQCVYIPGDTALPPIAIA
jgi:hypothetical protein